MSTSEPVLIAGGGIGGLATALALAKERIPTLVLERRSQFSEDGAGIQLGPNAIRILEEIGAAAGLRPRAAVPDALRVLDAVSGRDLQRLPLGRWIEERHGSPYWVAHRRDLQAALLGRVWTEPLITLATAAEITSAETAGGKVTAVAADGRTFTGPALVAADGVWSKLRQHVFATPAPIFTGKSAARAVIPMNCVPDALHRQEVHIWLAEGAHVVHYPVNAGHEVAIVVVLDEAVPTSDWSAPCDPSWFAAHARSFCPVLKDLLAAPETWRKWSLHALPSLPAFAKGRVALLGDAAHPVLPFLAQGGVLALEDAVTLAHCYAGSKNAEEALARYASQRRPRASRVFSASRRNGRVYHLSGVMAGARNLALATLPPSRVMAAYDWLYGWRAA